MSNANYNFIATNTQRHALALKREWTRQHITFWAAEFPLLVPSPAPREKTSLIAHPVMPSGTIAWVGDKHGGAAFIPSVKTKVFTTSDLHPRAAANNLGIWAQYATTHAAPAVQVR
jgi:hypothetical protein